MLLDWGAIRLKEPVYCADESNIGKTRRPISDVWNGNGIGGSP